MKISVNGAEHEVKVCPVKDLCAIAKKKECTGKKYNPKCRMQGNGITFRLLAGEKAVDVKAD